MSQRRASLGVGCPRSLYGGGGPGPALHSALTRPLPPTPTSSLCPNQPAATQSFESCPSFRPHPSPSATHRPQRPGFGLARPGRPQSRLPGQEARRQPGKARHAVSGGRTQWGLTGFADKGSGWGGRGGNPPSPPAGTPGIWGEKVNTGGAPRPFIPWHTDTWSLWPSLTPALKAEPQCLAPL